ncbi:MAG: FHA domain-containing protein [Deltaproteobacteria bacterium]|nr:FHA domain-containing protein [Deltaproteobacteria bacterium]
MNIAAKSHTGLDRPEGLPLKDFAEASHELELEDFEQLYGAGFLLHRGLLNSAPRRAGGATTMALETPPAASLPPGLDFLVFPVRKSSRSAYSLFVSIGRDDNHDIVLPDESVSRFHAYVTVDAAGRFLLYDSGSRNGTMVNEKPAPARGEGQGLELEPGARVRLGRIEMTFVKAPELRTLAQKLRKAK